MTIAFSIGSKCALLLPNDFVNSQITPAKGMVINKLSNAKTVILVEEVWQFNGFKTSPLSEKISIKTGNIREINWGWHEVPKLLKGENYLMFRAPDNSLLPIEIKILDSLIRDSITDFKRIEGI